MFRYDVALSEKEVEEVKLLMQLLEFATVFEGPR